MFVKSRSNYKYRPTVVASLMLIAYLVAEHAMLMFCFCRLTVPTIKVTVIRTSMII